MWSNSKQWLSHRIGWLDSRRLILSTEPRPLYRSCTSHHDQSSTASQTLLLSSNADSTLIWLGPPLLWSSLESKSGLYSNQTVTFFAQMFKDSASSHLLFDCCFLFDHSCFLCRPWRTLSSWSSLTMDGSCARKPSLKGSMRMITLSSSVFKFWNILSTRGKTFAHLILWFQMLLCKSSICIFCGENAKVLSQIECSIHSFFC